MLYKVLVYFFLHQKRYICPVVALCISDVLYIGFLWHADILFKKTYSIILLVLGSKLSRYEVLLKQG